MEVLENYVVLLGERQDFFLCSFILKKLFDLHAILCAQDSSQLHGVAVREGADVLHGQEGQGHPAGVREGPHWQEDTVTQVRSTFKSSLTQVSEHI